MKRHYLKKSILMLATAILLFLSSIIPDQTPTLLHTTKYAYTFGFPFPFVTIYSETSSGFILQHLSVNNSYSVNIVSLIANIILIYLVMTFFRNIFNKSQISTTISHMHS